MVEDMGQTNRTLGIGQLALDRCFAGLLLASNTGFDGLSCQVRQAGRLNWECALRGAGRWDRDELLDATERFVRERRDTFLEIGGFTPTQSERGAAHAKSEV